jgi:hypothetical protein
VEPGLVRQHAHEDPVPHPRVADVRLDCPNLHVTISDAFPQLIEVSGMRAESNGLLTISL